MSTRRVCRIGCLINTPAAPSSGFGAFVADGDSITFGVGVTTPWPTLVNSNLGNKYTLSNIAVSGANCGSTFPAAAAAALVAGKQNVLSIWCGTNNIAGGQTAAQTYAALSSYITGARAYAQQNGINLLIITGTMLSRDNPAGLDAVRATYNTAILGNAAGADVVINYGPTVLGCNGCSTNTTNFNIDEIHPNNTGEAVIVSANQAVMP